MTVDTKLKQLIINTLSPEQLPQNPSEEEIYLVEDDVEYASVEELAQKQDKLTAGANITIVDNVISATGGGEVAVNSVNGKTGTVVLTGADILADVDQDSQSVQDHLQDISDKVKDIELFKFPNAIITGEPTINNGQISGFSNADYLQFPFLVDLTNRRFQIDFCFTTGNDVTTQQNILDSQFGLALAIKNGKGLMAISHNGTSWAGQTVGTITIDPNTTYYARLSWNRINYQTSISKDGQTYTPDMNFGSTQSPYPRTMFIGGSPDLFGTGTAHPFKGSINLNKAYLTIDGSLIWQGMDDAGLATRADISLDNLDAQGQAKFDAKQNVLTPGAGISIVNDTISATFPTNTVTTDTNQTITGKKTFNNVDVNNTIDFQDSSLYFGEVTTIFQNSELDFNGSRSYYSGSKIWLQDGEIEFDEETTVKGLKTSHISDLSEYTASEVQTLWENN